MGALVNKVRDDYAVSNHKEFIVSSEEDFAMLPTSTEKAHSVLKVLMMCVLLVQ